MDRKSRKSKTSYRYSLEGDFIRIAVPEDPNLYGYGTLTWGTNPPSLSFPKEDVIEIANLLLSSENGEKKSSTLFLTTVGDLKKVYSKWTDLKKGGAAIVSSNLPEDKILLVLDNEIREMTDLEEILLLRLLEPSEF